MVYIVIATENSYEADIYVDSVWETKEQAEARIKDVAKELKPPNYHGYYYSMEEWELNTFDKVE